MKSDGFYSRDSPRIPLGQVFADFISQYDVPLALAGHRVTPKSAVTCARAYAALGWGGRSEIV